MPGSAGTYLTADGGAFHVDVQGDNAWPEFCEFGGIPEIGADPRWDSSQKRSPLSDFRWLEQSTLLRPHMARAMKNRTTEEWEQFFLERRDEIMYQRVFDYDDVINDEQALENGYIVEKDVPGVGKRPMAGNFAQFNKTPASAKPWFPELGQHTSEVMSELGFDEEQLAEVEAQKSPRLPMSSRARARRESR